MTQTKPRYIYSLSDPVSGDVRYVGATVNPMKRLSVHCAPSARRGAELGHWLSGLLNRGVRPALCVLERVDGPEWGARESWWIQHFRDRGHELLNRNAGGDGPPLLEDGRWSRDHDACIACGRTDRIHAGDGRCIACYNRQRHRARMQPDRPYYEWSLDYERCVECGTTERAHKGHGLCTNCFANRRTRLKAERNVKPEKWAIKFDCCAICGTTERPHKANGLCQRCDGRERYRAQRRASLDASLSSD